MCEGSRVQWELNPIKGGPGRGGGVRRGNWAEGACNMMGHRGKCIGAITSEPQQGAQDKGVLFSYNKLGSPCFSLETRRPFQMALDKAGMAWRLSWFLAKPRAPC